MADICRLCLRNEDYIKKQNIFDLSICDSLYWIFGVEVEATDEFSKWICQKCLNIINHVKKVRTFFQMNQFLLEEKKCPIDFDVECVNISMEAATQTDIPQEISTTKSLFPDDNNYSKHLPIPLELFNQLLSPKVFIPKLENIYPSLGYIHIKPLTYKKVMKILEEPKMDTNLVWPKDINELGRRSKYKTIGVNTELILGTCDLDDIFCSRKCSVATNIESEVISNPDHISTLNDTFESVTSPYIDQLFADKHEPLIEPTEEKITPIRKQMYMDYYYRMPTSAVRDLITRRDKTVKKESQESTLFKIEDVYHSVSCRVCNQVFKSKERLELHYDVKHNNALLIKKAKFNDVKIRTARKLRKSQKIIKTNDVLATNQDSSEEIDVISINKPQNLTFSLPEVVFFNELDAPEVNMEIMINHDHNYTK